MSGFKVGVLRFVSKWIYKIFDFRRVSKAAFWVSLLVSLTQQFLVFVLSVLMTKNLLRFQLRYGSDRLNRFLANKN